MPATPKKSKTKIIQFTLSADAAEKVSLVGEFNGWNPDADPMQREGGGIWTKTKALPQGNLEYKYWVDGEWILDPENIRVCTNGYGTLNNIVKVIL